MGLLTDPAGLQGRPFQFLVKYEGKICFLLYFAAIAWYCLLAHEKVNSGTYLSENALLPGLVVVGCDVTSEAKTLLAELKAEVASRHDDSMPTAWLLAKMRRAGLHPYKHNFTLNHPLRQGVKYTGVNVYGIMHGGGASTESVVLSVPYRGPSSPYPPTNAGLALLLAISSCFRMQKYWAKDIMLLVTEHEQLGAQAWLEAYHGATCGSPGILHAGELHAGRGGGIQAALNVELGSERITRVDVKISGLNGQLPNLDLVNLVHRICSKERVPHSFTNRRREEGESWIEKWLSSLATMTSMLLTQASGVPNANHGLFHRFGIEAVTLEGHNDGPNLPQIPFYHIGRVIEGIFRSINNLLERFHQSYFFYLLVDTDRFVSIGEYMPCVGMLVGALFIRAFALYLNLKSTLSSSNPPQDLNSCGVGLAVVWSYCCGILATVAPPYMTWAFPTLPTHWALLIGYSALTFILIITPFFLFKPCRERDWSLLLLAALIHIATSLISVAMHNFSLAFVAGFILTPLALIVSPGYKRGMVGVLWSPLFVAFVAVFLLGEGQFGVELLFRSFGALASLLALAATDAPIVGSTSLSLASLAYLPAWTILWSLVHTPVSLLTKRSPVETKKMKTN